VQETVTESGQRLRVIETALALLLVLLLLAATFRVLLPFAGVPHLCSYYCHRHIGAV
jgi:hypothetical protein